MNAKTDVKNREEMNQDERAELDEICARCLGVTPEQVTVERMNGRVYTGTYYLRGEDRDFRCVSTDHGVAVTQQ